MKTPLRLFLCALLAWAAPAAWAETSDAFGVAAGPTSGSGLAWRHWSGPLGFQVTGFPLLSSSETLLFAGVQGLLTVHEEPESKLFLYGGGSDYYSATDWGHFLSAGAGLGIQWSPGGHLGFDVEGGFGSTLNQTIKVSGFQLQVGVFYQP